jgi:thiamine-monophosphate kinase
LCYEHKATQITVSVAVSNRFPLEALDELFDGLHVLRENITLMLLVATHILSKGLIISITVGEADEDEIVYNGLKKRIY